MKRGSCLRSPYTAVFVSVVGFGLGLSQAMAQDLLYLEAHSRDLTVRSTQASPFGLPEQTGFTREQICLQDSAFEASLAQDALNSSLAQLLGSQYTSLVNDAYQDSLDSLRQYCSANSSSCWFNRPLRSVPLESIVPLADISA